MYSIVTPTNCIMCRNSNAHNMAKFIVKWFLPGDHRRTCIRVRIRFSSIKIEFGTEEPIYEAETQWRKTISERVACGANTSATDLYLLDHGNGSVYPMGCVSVCLQRWRFVDKRLSRSGWSSTRDFRFLTTDSSCPCTLCLKKNKTLNLCP